MVETITPVVHGGRGQRWAVLLALHAAGAAAAAATFGAVLAAAGALLDAPWGIGLAVVAAVAVLYLAELFGARVPIPQLRRQVPDWWRTFFPFGIASFLYGVGLGVGFFTYLSRGTLVVVSVAAVASGEPAVGALLMAPFGLARGLSAAVAFGARTPADGSRLVGELARSASWPGWRIGHGVALAAVLVTSLLALAGSSAPPEVGAMAAAFLLVVFGAAAAAKLARMTAWRRSLASFGLPGWIERPARVGVPVVELVIAALPLLGYASTAGAAAMAVLVLFSVGVVVARVRVGPRLGCGCFVGAPVRDYRFLLGRNAVLAVIATFAWRDGVDAPVSISIAMPIGSDLLPALLAVLGLTLAAWLGIRAVLSLRRGSPR